MSIYNVDHVSVCIWAIPHGVAVRSEGGVAGEGRPVDVWLQLLRVKLVLIEPTDKAFS